MSNTKKRLCFHFILIVFLCALFFFIICATEAQDIEVSSLKTPDFQNPPFSSIVEFARKHDVALNRIEISNNNTLPEKGNSVSFLLTLYKSSSAQQWLAIIAQDILTPEETQLEPLPEETIYSSTGRVFKFKNTRAALNFNLIGPFTATGFKSDKKYIKQLSNPYRVLISQEKLDCDLDLYSETALAFTKRCEAAGVNPKDLFYRGRTKPIPESDLEKGKSYTKIVNSTYEEEQIGFNVYFALKSFYDAAMDIDEFKDILYEVIDKPSVWSIISKAGLRTYINYNPSDVHPFNADNLGMKFPAYDQPLTLLFNGKLALNAAIIMTKSHAPLKACAGIIGLYAEHPVEKEKRLLIQLISAFRKE